MSQEKSILECTLSDGCAICNMRVWGRDIEENTMRQAAVAARHPAVKAAGHLALMPDAHVGMGATVGSVIPTKDAIIPSAVGVDIGCGMIAVLTDLTVSDLPADRQPLVDLFSRSIPAGVGRDRAQMKGGSAARLRRRAQQWLTDNPGKIGDLKEKALLQLGSLGSGNHFVEVSLDTEDRVWIVLHSGSRGVGNILAQQHIKKAKAATASRGEGLEDSDLSYFVSGTEEFDRYISDMLWAQDYALENREIMMVAALEDLFKFVGKGRERQRIQCHHNFAMEETHGGQKLWITRKGAIRAQSGDMGIIPSSMSGPTFIVEGLGNPDSYNSASHGGGRRLSRGRAKRELTTESLEAMMEGIAWNKNARALLDEHPDAYKDLGRVMEDQQDLVYIIHTLHQIVNYKGVN